MIRPKVLPWSQIARLPAVASILAASLLAPGKAAADWPSWVERWLFNPIERTHRALESFDRGEPTGAVGPLESALRLESDHPVAQYNAGTGRLVAASDDAVALLEAAAEAGSSDLVPRARYNLGNARMAGEDLPGAIEAYKQALRHDPNMEDAKFNLELALRRLEGQQRQERDQQQRDDQQDDQEEQSQKQPGQDEGQDGEQEPDADNQDQQQDQRDQGQQNREQQQQEQQEQQSQQEQQVQQRQQQQKESPLPRFHDLPDMTAAEAAAILEAIENLEREQRRRQALEASRKHARGTKDW